MSFNHIEASFAFNAECDIAEILSASIDGSTKSDCEIATELRKLSGIGYFTEAYITALRHNKFSFDRENFWPAWADVPFCIVTGDWSLVRHRLKLAKLCMRSSNPATSQGQAEQAFAEPESELAALQAATPPPPASAARRPEAGTVAAMAAEFERAHRYHGLFSHVARQLRVTPSHVRQVAFKLKTSPRVERALLSEFNLLVASEAAQ